MKGNRSVCCGEVCVLWMVAEVSQQLKLVINTESS